MTKQLRASLLLLSMFLWSSSLHAVGVEISAGGHSVTPWGMISLKGSVLESTLGTTLDLSNDLKFGKINTFIGRVRIDSPLILPNIYLIAHPMKFEGNSVRTISFTYGNQTFNADIPFNSMLKLDTYDLTLFYGVPGLKTATNEILEINLGLNVRYLDFKGEISQPQSGISESKSLTLPIPMGFLALQVAPIKQIALEGELKAIAYGNNRYYDLLGRLKFKPISFFFLAGGYGFQNIVINQESVNSDLRFGGPTLELGLEF